MFTKLIFVFFTLFGRYLCAEVGLFICNFNGKMYGELDVFDGGANGCAKCICIETRVYCNTTRCPSTTNPPPTTTTLPSTITKFEEDPNQEVESFNEIIYKPYQTGSGPVYRNRAGVYVHQLDDIDIQRKIYCPNGENC